MQPAQYSSVKEDNKQTKPQHKRLKTIKYYVKMCIETLLAQGVQSD